MNSARPSFATETGQCRICSINIKKNKIIQCNDCSKIFCKDHSRINPSEFKSYCIDCFVKNIRNEADIEMGDQMRAAKLQEQKTKLHIKEYKKEKGEKIQVIDRLQKLIEFNNENYLKRLDAVQKKIDEENNTTKNLNITVENLKITNDDTSRLSAVAEGLLLAARGEYENLTAEFALIKQENLVMKKKIREYLKKIDEFVPYARLRTLACTSCKIKIKKAFKNEIINGNSGRSSLVQSVLDYKTNSVRSALSIKQSVKKEPDNCCLCIIC